MFFQPEFFDGNYVFVKLKWESDDGLKDCSRKFLTENSEENYLRPQKVLSWLQRHIDLTLQKKDVKWPTDVLNVSIFCFWFVLSKFVGLNDIKKIGFIYIIKLISLFQCQIKNHLFFFFSSTLKMRKVYKFTFIFKFRPVLKNSCIWFNIIIMIILIQ